MKANTLSRVVPSYRSFHGVIVVKGLIYWFPKIGFLFSILIRATSIA